MNGVQLKIFGANFKNMIDNFETKIGNIKQIGQKNLIKYLDEKTLPIKLQLFLENQNKFCEKYLWDRIGRKSIDDFKIIETSNGFFLLALVKDNIFGINLSDEKDPGKETQLDYIHNGLNNVCVQEIIILRKIDENRYLFVIRSGLALFGYPRYENFGVVNILDNSVKMIHNQTNKGSFLIDSFNLYFENNGLNFEGKFCKDLYDYDNSFCRYYDGHRTNYDEGKYHIAKGIINLKTLDFEEIDLK